MRRGGKRQGAGGTDLLVEQIDRHDAFEVWRRAQGIEADRAEEIEVEDGSSGVQRGGTPALAPYRAGWIDGLVQSPM